MPARLKSLCKNLFQKRLVEEELDEELQATVEILTKEKIREGLPRAEARRQAILELGGVEQVKEDVRFIRTGRLFGDLQQDLRYALRSLTRSPGFTLVAVMILALGIGANAAVVSIIDAIIFRPLPVWRPDRLADISTTSYPDYVDLKLNNRIFDGVAAISGMPLEISGDGHPDGFSGRCVSANFFEVCGLKMAAGRGFSPDGASNPDPCEVVISYRYWKNDFQSDFAAIGKTLKLNGETLTIVGVAPKGFRDLDYFGAYRDVWIPISMLHVVQHLDKDPIWHDVLTARDKRWLGVLGRLKPEITFAQARAGIQVFVEQLKAAYPKTNADWNPSVNSLLHARMPKGATTFSLSIVLAAATCLLLITCTNVGSLLLGRVSARRREIATRLALGANRGRIARQLLTEGMVLSTLAFVACFAVWSAALRFLPAIEGTYPGLGTVGSPQDMELPVDHRIFIIGSSLHR